MGGRSNMFAAVVVAGMSLTACGREAPPTDTKAPDAGGQAPDDAKPASPVDDAKAEPAGDTKAAGAGDVAAVEPAGDAKAAGPGEDAAVEPAGDAKAASAGDDAAVVAAGGEAEVVEPKKARKAKPKPKKLRAGDRRFPMIL